MSSFGKKMRVGKMQDGRAGAFRDQRLRVAERCASSCYLSFGFTNERLKWVLGLSEISSRKMKRRKSVSFTKKVASEGQAP